MTGDKTRQAQISHRLPDIDHHGVRGRGAACRPDAGLSQLRARDVDHADGGQSGFIEKVAQLGADHVDEQFKNVRDNLDILSGLPSIQEADIADNTRLYSLMAAMLRNNPQLFNLYVGYEDGSFIEMDVIDRAKPAFRAGLKVDQDAAFRLVVISRTAGSRAGHAISVGEPDPGRRSPRPHRLRPAAAALVCRGVQERQDAADRALRVLRHRRARLHAADAAEGRPPRRRRRRRAAEPVRGHAGGAEARPIRARLPVQRCRAHRRPSRDEPPDG